MVSPVWESILTFRTAQLHTYKDLRFRKVPEYTAKHQVFYLSKLDIIIKSVNDMKQTMLYFLLTFGEYKINEHIGELQIPITNIKCSFRCYSTREGNLPLAL